MSKRQHAVVFFLALWCSSAALGQGVSQPVIRVADRVGGPVVFFSADTGYLFDGEAKETHDGGKTWNSAFLLPQRAKGETDWAIFPAPGLAMVRRYVNHFGPELKAVFWTTDQGQSWRKLHFPHFQSISVNLATSEVWLGSQKAIPVETQPEILECGNPMGDEVWVPTVFHARVGDGDPQWEEVLLPTKNGCPVHLIRFVDATHGVAVSKGSVFYTDNGGAMWKPSQVRFADGRATDMPAALKFVREDPSQGWLTYRDGNILATTDGGKSWTAVRAPDQPTGIGPWGNLHVAGPGLVVLTGDQGSLYETEDGGKTWSKIPTPEPIDDIAGFDLDCWLTGSSKALYHLRVGRR